MVLRIAPTSQILNPLLCSTLFCVLPGMPFVNHKVMRFDILVNYFVVEMELFEQANKVSTDLQRAAIQTLIKLISWLELIT
jgi:hypothetical protein